jgi:hypothetical protein
VNGEERVLAENGVRAVFELGGVVALGVVEDDLADLERALAGDADVSRAEDVQRGLEVQAFRGGLDAATVVFSVSTMSCFDLCRAARRWPVC